MDGKGLFPVVESGYDIREADAYIAFLLAEYNKAMERIALLEQKLTQDKDMATAAQERQGISMEELKEIRERFQQIQEQYALAGERERELRDKLISMSQENTALELKLREASEKRSPTVEHTAKIIAEILIHARDGGEQIVARATEEAEEILREAREKAEAIEAEAAVKAKRARDVFEESQKKIQEAYNFLNSFPEEFKI